MLVISSPQVPKPCAVPNSARRNISIRNVPELIAALKEQASKQCENPSLLCIYWYDAIQGPRMSLEQSMLAHQVGLKLRLGTLNNGGEQKGVDSLIVTDLIELARNRAISDAVILSGDEDLRVSVCRRTTHYRRGKALLRRRGGIHRRVEARVISIARRDRRI